MVVGVEVHNPLEAAGVCDRAPPSWIESNGVAPPPQKKKKKQTPTPALSLPAQPPKRRWDRATSTGPVEKAKKNRPERKRNGQTVATDRAGQAARPGPTKMAAESSSSSSQGQRLTNKNTRAVEDLRGRRRRHRRRRPFDAAAVIAGAVIAGAALRRREFQSRRTASKKPKNRRGTAALGSSGGGGDGGGGGGGVGGGGGGGVSGGGGGGGGMARKWRTGPHAERRRPALLASPLTRPPRPGRVRRKRRRARADYADVAYDRHSPVSLVERHPQTKNSGCCFARYSLPCRVHPLKSRFKPLQARRDKTQAPNGDRPAISRSKSKPHIAPSPSSGHFWSFLNFPFSANISTLLVFLSCVRLSFYRQRCSYFFSLLTAFFFVFEIKNCLRRSFS